MQGCRNHGQSKTCAVSSEQIAHNHRAQDKVAALMIGLANLDRFNALEQRRINLDPTSEGFMRIEYSYYSPFVLFGRDSSSCGRVC